MLFITLAAWHVVFKALREGKRCVTAHWLNTVLKRKKMVPPHRTLHLPFAFPPGAKPCSQHVGLTFIFELTRLYIVFNFNEFFDAALNVEHVYLIAPSS